MVDQLSSSNDVEESGYSEIGGEPGQGGAGAPQGAAPADFPAKRGHFENVTDEEWKALHSPTSDWDRCPNCGDRMVIKYDSDDQDPPIQFGKYIFTTVWQCHHCWTTTDRIVRMPAS